MKRSNVLEAGFIKAHKEIISEFLESNCRFTAAENQGIKLSKAADRLYGDSAIGYVQVKKEGPLCTVIVRVTPEHKVGNTGYRVTAAINERNVALFSLHVLTVQLVRMDASMSLPQLTRIRQIDITTMSVTSPADVSHRCQNDIT